MDYFIGWDVGAWKCKNAHKASCDALVVLNNQNAVGHYRNNLSETIQQICNAAEKARTLINAWFALCEMPQRYTLDDKYFIAIDTPLGWPKAFSMLIQGRLHADWRFEKAHKNSQNTLLFRKTERELGSSFSAVVDSIGSQSTKGMALLCALDATFHSWGVWRSQNITLLETYPKACLRSRSFVDWMCKLQLTHDIREWYKPAKQKENALVSQEDNFDAAVCACAARAFAEGNPQLKHPPVNDSKDEKSEGWIFYPTGDLVPAAVANGYSDVVNAEDVPALGEAMCRFRTHINRKELSDVVETCEPEGDIE